MDDLSSISEEEFQDLKGGIHRATKVLRERLELAEAKLTGNIAKDYSEYLTKFCKVRAYREVLEELQGILESRKI